VALHDGPDLILHQRCDFFLDDVFLVFAAQLFDAGAVPRDRCGQVALDDHKGVAQALIHQRQQGGQDLVVMLRVSALDQPRHLGPLLIGQHRGQHPLHRPAAVVIRQLGTLEQLGGGRIEERLRRRSVGPARRLAGLRVAQRADFADAADGIAFDDEDRVADLHVDGFGRFQSRGGSPARGKIDQILHRRILAVGGDRLRLDRGPPQQPADDRPHDRTERDAQISHEVHPAGPRQTTGPARTARRRKT
jgi:hypothetical protein